MIAKLAADPKAINCLLLCLYALNCARWAFAKEWGDALYWAGAFVITIGVTWRHF
ncbi:hypothetical protein A7A08_01680 [Methyloligella halotolerans]|uniref:Uncharacterized protein n=1 Tax=Methyloligella halotolerans TaxID=1177755 RepID=A0A1E2RZY1_9HYPH|nr:hypothetical protein [Methyloligella halotolerans]ODA67645.1 hypothetical protein A7A08_01680 [Methyloligella halotolerans]